MNNTTFTSRAWVQLGTGLTRAMVQSVGASLEVAYGATAPGTGQSGFDIPAGIPVVVPDIDSLGSGSIWVRSLSGKGAVRYVAA